MKVIASDENRFVLNIARGEELFETFLAWAKQEGIQGATMTGLGAADRLELAYYDLTTKKYERHTIKEEVEILSLTGNLALLEGARVLHFHGTFGYPQKKTRMSLALFLSIDCPLRKTALQ